MNMKATIGLLVALCIPALAATAKECKVVKDYPNGNYLIEIDGKALMTITEEQEKKILSLSRDILDVYKEMVAKDLLISKYEQAGVYYDTTIRQQKEYIAELEKVVGGYREMVRDYRKLNREPRVTFEGGIGATGDKKPAILLGIVIYKLRVSGFLQERNAGVIVGVALPLF